MFAATLVINEVNIFSLICNVMRLEKIKLVLHGMIRIKWSA